jgi:hypothetical protein
MFIRKLLLKVSVLLLALILAAGSFDCFSSPGDPEKRFCSTEIKPALFNDDHNSEGFLVQKRDGNLMLVFRLDPGPEGNHVGTDGFIAQMTYYPDEDRWGDVEPVYNSHEYDDRNIHGGVTEDGRIVIFFRHMDIVDGSNVTEGRYFLYSDDDGETWSGPHMPESWSTPENPDPRFGIWGTGQMFFNGDINRYMMLGYGAHLIYMTESEDGKSWDRLNLVKEDDELVLTEIAGAWTGAGRIIALIRDNRAEPEHQLLQIESLDNGATWSDPQRTHIPHNHWGAAPQLIYDESRDLLIAITSDRYTRDHSENSLFIYTARPDDVYGHPGNWTFESELLRPWASEEFNEDRPLNQSFYGYPTIAPVSEHEYLVVVTERAVIDGTEQADLYYFRMVFEKE